MSSFFDDFDGFDPSENPELARMIESGRLVHQPGMAADLMKELAPLLKADGIDLDDPNADFTEEQLSAAMARAQERHNLDLFTAVGAHRAIALLVLNDFTQELSEGDVEAAEEIIAAVPSDPDPIRASVAQIIGTGLGLLDSWFADADLGPKAAAAAAPTWSKPSRKAARDILVLARKRRGRSSLDSLTSNHTGFHVFVGTLLAVAGAISMIAKREGAEVAEVADRLLPTEEYEELFGEDGEVSADDRARLGDAADIFDELRDTVEGTELYQGFVAYLTEELGPVRPYRGIHSSVILLLSTALSAELDIEKPSGVIELIAEIERVAAGEPDADESAAILTSGFMALDEFIHYRRSIDRDPAQWHDVHELVERRGAQTDPLLSVLLAEVAEPPEDVETPEESEQAAKVLAQLPLVRGARELLSWIGEARPVSASGGLRRSDLAEAAGFFGIRTDAHGAGSAADVPVLGPVWGALDITALIVTNSASVRPGPAVANLGAGERLPVEEMRDLVMMFIVGLIESTAEEVPEALADGVVTLTAYRLTEFLAPDAAPVVPSSEGDATAESIAEFVEGLIAQLTALGLLRPEDGDRYSVPPEVRFGLASALLMALAVPEELIDGPEGSF